ncbi:MAG: hypothetical protein AB9856_05675 [Cellulosilyticaceae bacterium]
MVKYMRCNNCGYDMCGPEYIANTVDPQLYGEGPFYSNNALLEISTKPNSQIVCPFCNSIGNWSK